MSDRNEIRKYTVHEMNYPVLRSQLYDIVTDAKAMKDFEEDK